MLKWHKIRMGLSRGRTYTRIVVTPVTAIGHEGGIKACRQEVTGVEKYTARRHAACKGELEQQGTVREQRNRGHFQASARGQTTIKTSIGTRGFQWKVAMGNYNQKGKVTWKNNSGDAFIQSLGTQQDA